MPSLRPLHGPWFTSMFKLVLFVPKNFPSCLLPDNLRLHAVQDLLSSAKGSCQETFCCFHQGCILSAQPSDRQQAVCFNGGASGCSQKPCSSSLGVLAHDWEPKVSRSTHGRPGEAVGCFKCRFWPSHSVCCVFLQLQASFLGRQHGKPAATAALHFQPVTLWPAVCRASWPSGCCAANMAALRPTRLCCTADSSWRTPNTGMSISRPAKRIGGLASRGKA